jgi:hypothetical protein
MVYIKGLSPKENRVRGLPAPWVAPRSWVPLSVSGRGEAACQVCQGTDVSSAARTPAADLQQIPVVVNGPVGRPFPRPADGALVPLADVLL